MLLSKIDAVDDDAACRGCNRWSRRCECGVREARRELAWRGVAGSPAPSRIGEARAGAARAGAGGRRGSFQAARRGQVVRESWCAARRRRRRRCGRRCAGGTPPRARCQCVLGEWRRRARAGGRHDARGWRVLWLRPLGARVQLRPPPPPRVAEAASCRRGQAPPRQRQPLAVALAVEGDRLRRVDPEERRRSGDGCRRRAAAPSRGGFGARKSCGGVGSRAPSICVLGRSDRPACPTPRGQTRGRRRRPPSRPRRRKCGDRRSPSPTIRAAARRGHG